MDTGRTQELQTGIITVDLVIVDRFDTTLLYEKRAVHAGRVCDVNTRPVTGISVVGQFADRVQFRVLHFRARHQFSVDLDLAAVVISRRLAVPYEADDGVVFDNDAADF